MKKCEYCNKVLENPHHSQKYHKECYKETQKIATRKYLKKYNKRPEVKKKIAEYKRINDRIRNAIYSEQTPEKKSFLIQEKIKDYLKVKPVLKLTIELVPITAWEQNLKNYYSEKKWKELKEKVFAEEGRYCFICGSTNRLELHESWNFDYKTKRQILKEMHHLCHMCHKVKHWGFWNSTKQGKDALEKMHLTTKDLINHFCKINSCSKKDFIKHKSSITIEFNKRNKVDWIFLPYD